MIGFVLFTAAIWKKSKLWILKAFSSLFLLFYFLFHRHRHRTISRWFHSLFLRCCKIKPKSIVINKIIIIINSINKSESFLINFSFSLRCFFYIYCEEISLLKKINWKVVFLKTSVYCSNDIYDWHHCILNSSHKKRR